MLWRRRYRLGTKLGASRRVMGPEIVLTRSSAYVLGLISKANAVAVAESPRKRKRVRSQSPISVEMEDSDAIAGPSKLSSSTSGSSEPPSLNPQRETRLLLVKRLRLTAIQPTNPSLVQYAQETSLSAILTTTLTVAAPTQGRGRSRRALQRTHGRNSCSSRNQNPRGRISAKLTRTRTRKTLYPRSLTRR